MPWTIEVDDLMRRTTGRTGAECMNDLFQRELDAEQSWALVAEKEAIYRELFAPVFREVAGFRDFAARAHQLGMAVGVGTAGDRAQHRLRDAPPRHATLRRRPIVGGDEGLRRQAASRRSFSKWRGAWAWRHSTAWCSKTHRSASRRRAAPAWRPWRCAPPTRADQLAGPHVLAAIQHYNDDAATAVFRSMTAPENPHAA